MHVYWYKNKQLLLLPVMGTGLFVLLYFIAAFLYPGGSQANAHSTGFSWLNNYWCNLLNDTAINGENNAAQPVALIAMLALCLTLSLFWFLFSIYAPFNKMWKWLMQVTGILSMITAFFLCSRFNHDVVINIASGLGLIAIIGTYIGLYKKRWYNLFYFGLTNLLLIAANNYCYYSKDFIKYLPVVQKISFAAFLIWIVCISIRLYNTAR